MEILGFSSDVGEDRIGLSNDAGNTQDSLG